MVERMSDPRNFLAWVRLGLLGVCLLCLHTVAQAGGLMGLLGKSVQTSTSAAARAGFRQITRQEAIALSAGVGAAGVMFVEADGNKVMLSMLHGSSETLMAASDDVARLGPLAAKTSTPYTISQEHALALGDKIAHLAQSGPVYILDKAAGPMRLIVRTEGTQKVYYRELRPGMVTPLAGVITEDMIKALDTPVISENIRVVSMYPSTDTGLQRAIAQAAGPNLDIATNLEKSMLEGHGLDIFKDKTLVVVGPVDLQALDAMAADMGIAVFHAGLITDFGVSRNISMALKAKTRGEMLAALSQDTDLVISAESMELFSKSRHIDADAITYKDFIAHPTPLIHAFMPKTPATWSDIFENIKIMYIFGGAGFILTWMTHRRAIHEVIAYKPIPMDAGWKSMSMLRWVLREVLFVTLSPIFMLIVYVAILIGAWGKNGMILESLWIIVYLIGFLALWILGFFNNDIKTFLTDQ
ncbi:MAG: hypothetical protein AB3X41_09975 [Leptothrix ochracea]|uniref:hypothetical protein n=1 Tax=Leptothrix ochracea TaxID=735331 RepID=UPI0034E2B292